MHGLVWVQGYAYSTDASLQLVWSHYACVPPVFLCKPSISEASYLSHTVLRLTLSLLHFLPFPLWMPIPTFTLNTPSATFFCSLLSASVILHLPSNHQPLFTQPPSPSPLEICLTTTPCCCCCCCSCRFHWYYFHRKCHLL